MIGLLNIYCLFRKLSDGVFLGEEREDFGVHVEDVGHNLLVDSLPGSLNGLLEINQRSEGRFHQPRYPDLICLPARNLLQVQTPSPGVASASFDSVEEGHDSNQMLGSICDTLGLGLEAQS